MRVRVRATSVTTSVATTCAPQARRSRSFRPSFLPAMMLLYLSANAYGENWQRCLSSGFLATCCHAMPCFDTASMNASSSSAIHALRLLGAPSLAPPSLVSSVAGASSTSGFAATGFAATGFAAHLHPKPRSRLATACGHCTPMAGWVGGSGTTWSGHVLVMIVF